MVLSSRKLNKEKRLLWCRCSDKTL